MDDKLKTLGQVAFEAFDGRDKWEMWADKSAWEHAAQAVAEACRPVIYHECLRLKRELATAKAQGAAEERQALIALFESTDDSWSSGELTKMLHRRGKP